MIFAATLTEITPAVLRGKLIHHSLEVTETAASTREQATSTRKEELHTAAVQASPPARASSCTDPGAQLKPSTLTS